jgi:hypothetical protein
LLRADLLDGGPRKSRLSVRFSEMIYERSPSGQTDSIKICTPFLVYSCQIGV